MATVRNNTARLINIGGEKTLMPGINEVDADVWQRAQKIVAVQAMTKKQGDEDKPWLEVVGSSSSSGATTTQAPAPGTGETANALLHSMNVTDAKTLVSETYDRTLLEQMRASETRGGVQQAIDAQLEKLKLSEAEKTRRK